MCLWSRMLHLKDHQPDITLSAGRPKSSCKRRHNHIWCLSGGCPAGCTLPFPSPRGETRFFGEPLQKIDTSKLAAQNGKKKKGARRKGSDLLRQLCGLRPLSDWTSLSHGWKFGPSLARLAKLGSGTLPVLPREPEPTRHRYSNQISPSHPSTPTNQHLFIGSHSTATSINSSAG